jgi:hypothetical protein
MKIAVIGAGAAGFFGAIHAAGNNPSAEVHLLERTGKLLSKLRISGGGRCNVTHYCFDKALLTQGYPRGYKELRSAFEQFDAKDMVDWLQKRGVKTKAEADGRMFPVTDNSETIASCLENAAAEAGVKILLHQGVESIVPEAEGYVIELNNGKKQHYDRILIAAGGGPKLSSYNWLSGIPHTIIEPVPSLFTFNIPDKSLHALAGISVPEAKISIQGTKLEQTGPLLITHWGLSGPAILKLSAWGARELAERNYQFAVTITWLPGRKEDDLRNEILKIKELNHKKQIGTFSPFSFPLRLWKWFLLRLQINEEMKWADASKKDINRLVVALLQMSLNVTGKSTFKDEFVTAGGISLKDVDMKTMQSRKYPGIFFAGEVLNIDGITGGFNFQAAWTTGYIAGKNIGK